MELFSNQLVIKAELSGLDEVLSFVEEGLSQTGCPPKLMTQIVVSVEEIFVNVANYAYKAESGDCRMELCVCGEGAKRTMKLLVTDEGEPFDPLAKQDPDITLSADQREIGGLGIWMVKQTMDEVTYQYVNQKNELTLIKMWELSEE